MGIIVKFVCKSSKSSLCEGNLFFTFYPLKAAKRNVVIIKKKNEYLEK